MSGVRRGDGSDEAAMHLSNLAEFHAGIEAYGAGQGYDPDAGDHWRDGWIHAAEITQSRGAILQRLPLVRSALMGAYRLIKNAPAPRKPSFRDAEARREALVDINLALAHLPAETKEDA